MMNTSRTFLSFLAREHPDETPWLRRIGKIEMHYSLLSVEYLFERHPRLEEYLKEDFDDKLVAGVRLASHNSTLLGLGYTDAVHTQMSTAATNQRATHTTYIQQEVLQYLQPSNAESLGFDIPANLSKEERGLEAHVTARFLIPRQHLEAFEKDPDRYVTPRPYVYHSLAPPESSPSFKTMKTPTGH
jgi:hypothetical protein